MGTHTLHWDRIQKIEQDAVAHMEREMREMITTAHHAKSLVEKGEKMQRRHEDLQQRREADRQAFIEQHRARGEEHDRRIADALSYNEQQRQRLIAVGVQKRQLHDVKQAQFQQDREEMRERHRIEGDMKRQYINYVLSELDRKKEEHRDTIARKLDTIDAKVQAQLENAKHVREDRRQRRDELHQQNMERKADHWKQWEAFILQKEAKIFDKYARSEQLKQERENNVEYLNQVKEDCRLKKQYLRGLLEKAEKTRNFNEINAILQSLQQAQSPVQSIAESYRGHEDSTRSKEQIPRDLNQTNLMRSVNKAFKTSQQDWGQNASTTRLGDTTSSVAGSNFSTPEKLSFSRVSARSASPRTKSKRLGESQTPGRARTPSERQCETPGSAYDHLMALYKGHVS